MIPPEVYERIRERIEAPVALWQPEPGGQLIGELIDVDPNVVSQYGQYTIVKILDCDGTVWTWHVFDTAPRQDLARLGACRGDYVGARYVGERQGRENTYKEWRVDVQPGGHHPGELAATPEPDPPVDPADLTARLDALPEPVQERIYGGLMERAERHGEQWTRIEEVPVVWQHLIKAAIEAAEQVAS